MTHKLIKGGNYAYPIKIVLFINLSGLLVVLMFGYIYNTFFEVLRGILLVTLPFNLVALKFIVETLTSKVEITNNHIIYSSGLFKRKIEKIKTTEIKQIDIGLPIIGRRVVSRSETLVLKTSTNELRLSAITFSKKQAQYIIRYLIDQNPKIVLDKYAEEVLKKASIFNLEKESWRALAVIVLPFVMAIFGTGFFFALYKSINGDLSLYQREISEYAFLGTGLLATSFVLFIPVVGNVKDFKRSPLLFLLMLAFFTIPLLGGAVNTYFFIKDWKAGKPMCENIMILSSEYQLLGTSSENIYNVALSLQMEDGSELVFDIGETDTLEESFKEDIRNNETLKKLKAANNNLQICKATYLNKVMSIKNVATGELIR